MILIFEISDFVSESCQTKTAHRVPEIHFYNDNLFFFAAKEELNQQFDGIEENIYYKHKDDAYEKGLINLLFVFNLQLLFELLIIQYFVKILMKFRE